MSYSPFLIHLHITGVCVCIKTDTITPEKTDRGKRGFILKVLNIFLRTTSISVNIYTL